MPPFHPQLEGAAMRVDPSTNEPYLVVPAIDSNGIQVISINRKRARNGFDGWLFLCLADALNAASQNDKVLVVVLTGEGDYFSSGADLRSKANLGQNRGLLHDPTGVFMQIVLQFPKILVAAVNGPAIGVGCSILPICDMVFATPEAYFQVPFSRIAVCPEFCSSVTFPQLLGHSTANEMLLFGKQLNAVRAHKLGLVSHLIPREQFLPEVLAQIRSGLIPVLMERTLPLFKQMLRKWDADFMLKVCADELVRIDKRAADGDIATAVQAFMGAKAGKL
ncbi:hypothetical protein BASA81_010552 [Batrachochytrium salamandrivorans]|nr:hypothetical protein BASA81_010552 [Batrachochytrium salamandrivorans]